MGVHFMAEPNVFVKDLMEIRWWSCSLGFCPSDMDRMFPPPKKKYYVNIIKAEVSTS